MKYLWLVILIGCSDATSVTPKVVGRCADGAQEMGYSETDSLGHLLVEMRFCSPPLNFGMVLRALKITDTMPVVPLPTSSRRDSPVP